MTVGQALTNNFVGIGARLRSERVRLGLNQGEIAKLAGVSTQTQMRYETGQQVPKLEFLVDLASHGVDAGYIVTGTRSDGTIHPLEQSFLNDFRRLDDQAKEAAMYVVAAMLDFQAGEVSDEAGFAQRIVGALVDYRSPTADDFLKGLRQGGSSNTLHTSQLSFRGEGDVE